MAKVWREGIKEIQHLSVRVTLAHTIELERERERERERENLHSSRQPVVPCSEGVVFSNVCVSVCLSTRSITPELLKISLAYTIFRA